MTVVQPASVDDLQFRVTTRPGGHRAAPVGDVMVRSCREANTSVPLRDPVWSIEAEADWVRVSVLKYGVAPSGFRVVVPAKPLRTGACYWIAHSGPEGVYVLFDDEGVGTEVTWHDAMVFEGLASASPGS